MTPENRIKRQICAWLRIKRSDIFFWVNDSVGIFDPIKKVYRANKDPFRIKGVSDILGIMPGGRFLAIEVKTDTGKISKEQKNFIDQINKHNGVAFVARSIEDVEHEIGTL